MIQAIFFWIHIVVMIGAISIGFFLPFLVVLALVILHRIHIIIFDGCILSRLQQYFGALAHNENFLQDISRTLFKREISLKQSLVLDYILISIPLSIATLRMVV